MYSLLKLPLKCMIFGTFVSFGLIFDNHFLQIQGPSFFKPTSLLGILSDQKRKPTEDEARVFKAIDLSLPELSSVNVALKNEDYEAASSAWATYLRNRKGYKWIENEIAVSYNKSVAEDALSGKVQGGYLPLFHSFPKGKIDWLYNATKNAPHQSLDYEWQWQLNRMLFWSDMARAYLETRDEQYPKAFARQLHSWIAQCPIPEKVENTPGSSWRTIEAGIRMSLTWPEAFFSFLNSPSLSDADIMAYTRSILDHAHYLRKNSTGANWLLMEMNGLSTIGFFFPEFLESKEWRSYAISRMTEELNRQFLPDGGQYELSLGYHEVSIENFLALLKHAQWTGHEKEIPMNYIAALEKAYEWSMLLSTPDRNRPKFNDSWSGSIARTLREAESLFPSREDFLWFTSDRQKGKPPEQTSIFLDWTGFAVMRSGWETNANYLLFDVGPLGYGGQMGEGHAHQDKLNVVLWSYGREILFDDGGGNYAWDKWRIWSRSSLSHNCMIVDGLGQARTRDESNTDPDHDPAMISQKPIQASWLSNSNFDFAAGIYNKEYGTPGYIETSDPKTIEGVYDFQNGPQKRLIATQQRQVIFIKPDLYLVADKMTPLDDREHTYQARWHLLSKNTLLNPVTHSVMTIDEDVPNLMILPLYQKGLTTLQVQAQEKPALLGWYNRRNIEPRVVPATTVLHTQNGAGIKTFLTLLFPIKAGEKKQVTYKQIAENLVEFYISDGRKFSVSIPDDEGIEVQEILLNGELGKKMKAKLAPLSP